MRTLLHIAMFAQPGDPANVLAKRTIDFKGQVPETEALTRAQHIIRTNPRLGHAERGYLLNCLDNGNYTYELTTEPSHA